MSDGTTIRKRSSHIPTTTPAEAMTQPSIVRARGIDRIISGNTKLQITIVQKSGAWFTYGDLRLGQGRDKSRQFLEENPKVLQELHTKVLEQQQHSPMPLRGGSAESNGQAED